MRRGDVIVAQQHEVGGQAEVFEDVCGDVSVGNERDHAQGIAAARALGDLVAENPAQQSGPIEAAGEHHRWGGGVIGLAGSGAAGSAGTTRERQWCAEDRTP